MKKELKVLIKIAVLSAIAFLFYFILEFPLLPGAPFLKFDFSDIPAVIGGLALGPIAGIIIQFIKNILHLFLKANEGSPIGEVANFIVGISYIIPVSLLYLKKKNIKSLILGMAFGIISMVIVAVVFNYLVFIPIYAPALLEAGAWQYLLTFIIPFNALKACIISVIAVLLYKYLVPIINK